MRDPLFSPAANSCRQTRHVSCVLCVCRQPQKDPQAPVSTCRQCAPVAQALVLGCAGCSVCRGGRGGELRVRAVPDLVGPQQTVWDAACLHQHHQLTPADLPTLTPLLFASAHTHTHTQVSVAAAFTVGSLSALRSPTPTSIEYDLFQSGPRPPLRVQGSQLVRADGSEQAIHGVNWVRSATSWSQCVFVAAHRI